jgi:hypothetical protein
MNKSDKLIEIKQEQEVRISALFKECGVFFAFGNQQFEENKTPLEPGEKYRRIVGGGFLPAGKAKQFEEGFDAIDKWFTQETKKCRTEHILYELSNHECFYTGDITPVVEFLPYSRKTIQKVYSDHRKSHAQY